MSTPPLVIITDDPNVSEETNEVCHRVQTSILMADGITAEIAVNSLFRLLAGQIAVYGIPIEDAKAYLEELTQNLRIIKDD